MPKKFKVAENIVAIINENCKANLLKIPNNNSLIKTLTNRENKYKPINLNIDLVYET